MQAIKPLTRRTLDQLEEQIVSLSERIAPDAGIERVLDRAEPGRTCAPPGPVLCPRRGGAGAARAPLQCHQQAPGAGGGDPDLRDTGDWRGFRRNADRGSRVGGRTGVAAESESPLRANSVF